MKKCLIGLAAWLPCCLFAMQVEVATETETDVYTVTDEVLVQAPCKFGVNVEAGAPLPWVPTRIANLWNVHSSMEPYEVRHVHTFGPECTNDGAKIIDAWNSPKETGKNFWHGGLGWWDGVPVGMYDGGDAVIYRNQNGTMEKIHTAKVKRYSPQPKGSEFVELDPPLADPVRPNDILVIDKRLLEWPSQDGLEDVKMRERLSMGRYNQFAPERNSGVSFDFDSAQFCPEGGSTASMRVTLPGGSNKGLFQWFSSTGEFQQTHPDGAVFKSQIWLRQEGLSAGKVRVQFGTQYSEEVVVGPEWKKYEFSFVFDRAKIPSGKGPDKLGVYSSEAGTLWMDNFALWDSSEPLGSVRKIHLDALKESHPATLRIWTPLHRNSLADALFGEVFTAKTMPGKNFDGLSVHQQLELCKEVGADPWLNLHPLTSDEELAALMEYLAGPADSAYGKLRAARGQVEPWSSVFGKIYLECGNETWNSIFAPLAWPGKADVYAAVANRIFRGIKASTYYKAGQILCVASGWGHSPSGWTKQVAELATGADVVDVAAYFGGSDGFSVKGAGDDDETIAKEIIKGQLILCGPGLVGQLRVELGAMRDQLKAKTGRDILLADYESGPGYIIPGPGQTHRPRDEKVGKSLGMGVVTLDCFLLENSLGFISQNYFKYNVGHNWVTHNNETDRFPQASWIALTMRNKYCDGSMMKVTSPERKTVNVPAQELEGWTYDGKPRIKKFKGQQNIPLTECYAFKDGKKHAFVVFSRSAEEPRTVTLNLPYEPKGEADLYFLTGDYFDGNAAEYKIREQHRKITGFKKEYTFILPPASIYIYVSEEK